MSDEPNIEFFAYGEGEFTGHAWTAVPIKITLPDGSDPMDSQEQITKLVNAAIKAVEENGGEVCVGPEALVALHITYQVTEAALAEMLRERAEKN